MIFDTYILSFNLKKVGHIPNKFIDLTLPSKITSMIKFDSKASSLGRPCAWEHCARAGV